MRRAGPAGRHNFGLVMLTITLGFETMGGVLSAEAGMRTYSYTGGGTSIDMGPTHSANYEFDSTITDEFGDPMP